MSDPHPKWLADDPSFLASLNELDRGLAGGGDPQSDAGDALVAGEDPPHAVSAPPAPRQPPAPRSGTVAARPAGARATARAINPARVLDTAASARPLKAAATASAASVASPRGAPSPAPVRVRPPETVGGSDVGEDPLPSPPLAFARPSTEPRAHRPLLDLFPASALEAERPALPEIGTAVGPQLPPPRPRPVPVRASAPDASSRLDALTYETFYGLREKPFSLSTDPRFQYPSASHERAEQELLAAIRKRSGPAVLTGPMGTGKTTLCRSLVQEIDRRTVTSLVLEPFQSIDDLLQTMLVDFGVMSRDDLANAPRLTRDALTDTVHSFLESLVPLQASAVVIIDEAQNLPAALLGDVGALLGADNPHARVLQLVLVGQPALTRVLKHPDLRRLDAGVARRTELGPLDAEEMSGYVMHRLSIAGAHTRIEFDDAAIARLFELSAGVPRVVNLLCDRAMTRGQQASAAVIDDMLIQAAAADLDLDAPAGDRPGPVTSLLIAVAFAFLVLAGAAAAVWVSRDAVARTILQWQNIPSAPDGPIRRLPVPITPITPPAEVPEQLP